MNFLKMGIVRHANANGCRDACWFGKNCLVRFTCLYGKLGTLDGEYTEGAFI